MWVIDCRPVKVETFFSASACWDTLQPSVTLHRISRYRKWMDGCLLFTSRGSMTQRSTSRTGTGRLEGNSLSYQSSQTSHNNLTSQLSWTCHISFDVCLSVLGRTPPPPPQSKKKKKYKTCIFQDKVLWTIQSFNRCLQFNEKESCKCCLQNYANRSSQWDPGTKQKEKKKRCI